MLAAERINSPSRTNDATSPQYPCRECDKVFSRQGNCVAVTHFLNFYV